MEHILAHLSQDKILAGIIKNQKIDIAHEVHSPYDALVGSVISQQISTKAADAIYKRFIELFPGGKPEPHLIISLPEEAMRAAGLSFQKAKYLKNIATFFLDEKLLYHDWDMKSDEEIVSLLTQIKGVGVWTVQMILMFSLDREDVFPYKDFGIQTAMREAYKLDGEGRQFEAKMITIAQNWSPYRTYASKYLWKWKDTTDR